MTGESVGSVSISADPQLGLGDVCREILASVPEWFGIPEANGTIVALEP